MFGFQSMGFGGGGFGPPQFSNRPPQMPPQFGGFGGFGGAPQFGGEMMMGPPSQRFGGGMPQGGGFGGFPPQGMQQFGGGYGGGGVAAQGGMPDFWGGGMGPQRSAPQFNQAPQFAGPPDAEFMRNISGLSPAVQQQMLAERQQDKLPPGQRQFGPSTGPDVASTFVDMGRVYDDRAPQRGFGGFPPPGMPQFGGGMPQFGGGGGQRQPQFGGGMPGFGGPQGMPFGGGFQAPQFAMPQFGGLLGFGGGMPSNMGPQMPQQGGGQMGIGNFMQDQLRNAGMGSQRPQNKSMVEGASRQMQNMPPMMGDMQYRGGPMTPEQEAFGAQREQDMRQMMQMAGLNPGVSQTAYRRRNGNRE